MKKVLAVAVVLLLMAIAYRVGLDRGGRIVGDMNAEFNRVYTEAYDRVYDEAYDTAYDEAYGVD